MQERALATGKRVASKNRVRNITLVQHLVHRLNSENHNETSARVRGNSNFLKLNIKKNSSIQRFPRFLKMSSSARVPDVAGAERCWSPAPAPSSETLFLMITWINCLYLL